MRKDFPQKKRTIKSTRLAVAALMILMLSLMLAKTLSFVQSFDKPVNLITQKNYNWNGRSSLNIVYFSFKENNPQIAIISLDPSGKSTILSIPNKTYAKLPAQWGWWEVGSIYKLGEGVDLLKLSLSGIFGLPLDGIIMPTKSTQTAEEFVNSLRSNPFSLLTFASDMKTDLSPREILLFYKTISGIRADKLTGINLEKSDITESKLLKDSSRVLGINTVKLDLYIRDGLAESSILEEGKSIAVFNGTKHQGIAAEAARFITNMGGNVVIISSAEYTKNSVVYIQNYENEGLTSERLTQVFAPSCIKTKCTTTDPAVLNSRAQISIVLGEDYFEFWNKK